MQAMRPYESHIPQAFALGDLRQAALDALHGDLAPGLGEPDRATAILHWLIWSQGDAHAARRQWHYLDRPTGIPDRDAYALGLWQSLDREQGPNRRARAHIENDVASWAYYGRHFFGWFLSRFNLPAARKVFSDNRFVAGLHYLFLAVSLAAAGIPLWLSPHPDLRTSLMALGAVAVLLIFGAVVSGIPKYAYIHSLIPRMGAAVGIGYLFLASAPHLIEAIYQSPWTPDELIVAATALLVVTLLYVPVHISRRVYPPPRWPKLFRLGLDVVALGVGYTALELLLFAPLLFSKAFLCEPGQECTVNATPAQQILCAAIALILGIVLQLAWDEKPLTEPL